MSWFCKRLVTFFLSFKARLNSIWNAPSGARGGQVTFPWLEPLLFLAGITSAPPLLLLRRLRLLLRLLRVSALLQRSVRLLDPKITQRVSAFPNRCQAALTREPPGTETSRAVRLRSECGRRSRTRLDAGSQQVAGSAPWPLRAQSWGEESGRDRSQECGAVSARGCPVPRSAATWSADLPSAA